MELKNPKTIPIKSEISGISWYIRSFACRVHSFSQVSPGREQGVSPSRQGNDIPISPHSLLVLCQSLGVFYFVTSALEIGDLKLSAGYQHTI